MRKDLGELQPVAQTLALPNFRSLLANTDDLSPSILLLLICTRRFEPQRVRTQPVPSCPFSQDRTDILDRLTRLRVDEESRWS